MDRLLNLKDARNQPIFQPTEKKTIAFKEQILPYWSQLCNEVSEAPASTTATQQEAAEEKSAASSSLQGLFEKFKQKAEEFLFKSDSSGKSDLNWLTGGLAVDDSVPARSLATLKVQLAQELKLFGLKFKQMEERRETVDEML